MPKVKQLSVSVKHQPGSLARVASILGRAKVNVVAFLTGATGDDGFVKLVVDDVNKAKKSLDREGFSCTEEAVLLIEIPNKPGTLGEFAGKLAARNINITSGYATTVSGTKKASLVLAVSDLGKAVRIR
jgi:hypothetical protein